MFGKLKDKLKGWAKSISKDKEEEEIVEAPKPEKKEKAPKGVPRETSKEVSTGGKKKKETVLEKAEELVEEVIEKGKEVVEEIKEKVEEVVESKEEPKEKEGFFKRAISKVQKVKISDEEFDVYAEDLEMLLLENNVALEVAEKIVKELREKIVGKELLKKEIEGEIYDSIKDIIEEILIDGFLIKDKVKEKEDKPYVVLFCGVNGTGKTTSIAKVAKNLQDNGVSCVLAAADTFRAASIEQIKIHGDKLGVKVIAQDYGVDPAAVGFDAIKYAKKNKIDCVLIDTAGRMHSSKNLVQELEKIARVTKPDLKVFVGESITGNDVLEQVKTFNFAIGIDGIILSKADIDEKGGTALSVGYITKKPILYLGTGQEYDDIEPFDKKKFIEKLGL